jgi:hypothetical protein
MDLWYDGEVELDPCQTTTDGTGTGVPRETKGTIYLAGKISGRERAEVLEEINHYQAKYEGLGYKVINPSRLDDWKLASEFKYTDFIAYGVLSIIGCITKKTAWGTTIKTGGPVDAVYMLPSWTDSPGARLERLAAETCKIPVYFAETGDPALGSLLPTWEKGKSYLFIEEKPLVGPRMNVPGEGWKPLQKPTTSVLEEAQVVDERMKSYGHPADNFQNISELWSTFTGVVITAEDVAMMMVLLKVGRLMNGYHRDSVVDGAGYFRTLEIVHEYEASKSNEG